MNFRDINKLAELMESKDLTLVEINEGDTKIKMERGARQVIVPAAAAAPVMPAASGNAMEAIKADSPANTPSKAQEDKLNVIKSPTVGVFYSSSSPEAKPYVEIGSSVKKGDVVCLIEAMKLMNEIQSDVDGEIAEICVDNGQVVEFGQPLFRIK